MKKKIKDNKELLVMFLFTILDILVSKVSMMLIKKNTKKNILGYRGHEKFTSILRLNLFEPNILTFPTKT